MNTIIIWSITFRLIKNIYISGHNYSNSVLFKLERCVEYKIQWCQSAQKPLPSSTTWRSPCTHLHISTYVTGSGKRDIFAHTMIFQYKGAVAHGVSRSINFSQYFFLLLHCVPLYVCRLCINFQELCARILGMATLRIASHLHFTLCWLISCPLQKL